MELADYLRTLRRRWWLVALALVVCIAGAALATYVQDPTYRASARLLVSGASSTSAIDEISRRQLATERAVAYAQIASTGPAVSAAVIRAGATGASVEATADGDSPFLSVIVTAGTAEDAQAVANAYVRTLPRVIIELEQSPSATPPTLSLIEPAGLPSSPHSPRPIRNLLIGGVLGLVLGVAIALLRETLDVTIRSSAEVERVTGAPVIGTVPQEFSNERLPALTRPQSGRSEAYRHVRTNLEFTGPEGAPRSIVVTSAGSGDGKTTLSTNLAVIASRAGKSVVIVDADLRKPMVATAMGVKQEPGLSDVLSGSIALDDALQPVSDELMTILPSGRVPRSPSELLGSTAMVELLDELERRYDMVIVDTPPVLPVTDALLVGVHVAGVVVVTRVGETTRGGIKRAVEAVRKVNAKVLGIVVNAAAEPEDKTYGYGYGYVDKRRADAADMRPTEHVRAASRRQTNNGARRVTDTSRHSDDGDVSPLPPVPEDRPRTQA